MEHQPVHHRHTASTASTASIATTTTTRSSSTNSVSSTSPVLVHHHRHSRLQPREPAAPVNFAECAGGTAAECAAVCCCLPCGIAAVLLCALVKLPAGLCRRALLRKRRRRIAAAAATKKRSAAGAPPLHACGRGCDVDVEERFGIRKEKDGEGWVIPAAAALAMSPEFVAMEKEMWARFYGTGFWRSPSQREDLR